MHFSIYAELDQACSAVSGEQWISFPACLGERSVQLSRREVIVAATGREIWALLFRWL